MSQLHLIMNIHFMEVHKWIIVRQATYYNCNASTQIQGKCMHSTNTIVNIAIGVKSDFLRQIFRNVQSK